MDNLITSPRAYRNANGAADGVGSLVMHASEAAYLAALATGAADEAAPDTRAAAAAAAALAHAAAATAIRAATTGAVPMDPPTRKDPPAPNDSLVPKASTKTSPKVWASTIAGAIAITFWTIAAATFWKNTFSSEALAALIASTTTIVSAAAAYLTRDQLRAKN
jgi:hypothetical protein